MSNFYEMIEMLPRLLVQEKFLDKALLRAKEALGCETSSLGYDKAFLDIQFELRHGVSIEGFQHFMSRDVFYQVIDERMKEEMLHNLWIDPKKVHWDIIQRDLLKNYDLVLPSWGSYATAFKKRHGYRIQDFRALRMQEKLPHLTLTDFVKRLACYLKTDNVKCVVGTELAVWHYVRKASVYLIGRYGGPVSEKEFLEAFKAYYRETPRAYCINHNKLVRSEVRKANKQKEKEKQREKENRRTKQEQKEKERRKKKAAEKRKREKARERKELLGKEEQVRRERRLEKEREERKERDEELKRNHEILHQLATQKERSREKFSKTERTLLQAWTNQTRLITEKDESKKERLLDIEQHIVATMEVRLKAPHVTLDTLVTYFSAKGILPPEIGKKETRSWLTQVFKHHVGLTVDEYQRLYQIVLPNSRITSSR